MLTKPKTDYLDHEMERLPRWRRRLSPPLLTLALVCLFVTYGLYRFQLRPLLTMTLPDHTAQPLDTVPVELTSFQVRLDGVDVVPSAVAFANDSLYVAYSRHPAVQIYSAKLKLLKTIRLERPQTVTPNSIAVTDSLLIVADSAGRQLAFYDREGDFLTSIQWYPDQSNRIDPLAIASDGRRLAVVDGALNRIAIISLIDNQPFTEFLELLDLLPHEKAGKLSEPRMALLTPDNALWVGESRTVSRFTGDGQPLGTVEPPPKTRIVLPFAATIVADIIDSSEMRIHVLDKVAGKVFVYDLGARLRLVYPRDRALQRPSGIAVDPTRRTIFITETETASITVFGY